jgi:hypothetical protein
LKALWFSGWANGDTAAVGAANVPKRYKNLPEVPAIIAGKRTAIARFYLSLR